jgi:hypothetical protein
MILAAVCVIVLLVGYVLYFARLLSIVFCGNGQKHVHPLCPGECSNRILIDEMEDCDYVLFWRSQQPALEFLAVAGPDGAGSVRLKEFYREFAHKYPELCDGSTFEDWLQAMRKAEVVATERNTITITGKGKFILENLEREGLESPSLQVGTTRTQSRRGTQNESYGRTTRSSFCAGS